MFTTIKIFSWILDPANILLIGLIVGTLMLWRRRLVHAARRLLSVVTCLAVLLATLPLGHAMITVLENRFPIARDLGSRVDGIIVLGGAVNQQITASRGQVSLTDGAERMTEFVALARRYPEAKLVFTGGSGSLMRPDLKETLVARMFFDQMGLDRGRVILEDQSRSTFENAVATFALVRPASGERWVLVTSARHMPRSVGSFRRAGWTVIPYPVDFTTDGEIGLSWQFSLAGGLSRFSAASYEWMALAVYRALERTDRLFPGPLP